MERERDPFRKAAAASEASALEQGAFSFECECGSECEKEIKGETREHSLVLENPRERINLNENFDSVSRKRNRAGGI